MGQSPGQAWAGNQIPPETSEDTTHNRIKPFTPSGDPGMVPSVSAITHHITIGVVDPSTLFGLERTVLSSMNILLAITMIGGGIMLINAGTGPRVFGATLIFVALILLVASVLFF